MTAADLHKRQELFYSVIDQVEKDYYLYFGLKSIQKKLTHTESVYDHFILNHDTFELSFDKESDLPQEIRDLIISAYQETFLLREGMSEN
ncbi:hypothetical protein TH53_15285 [Pedobacter lusitanus]|uniref:Uncharacterized protein n=1 Tax=Pedobacter lusitanus TaxID=1503925 RepID=A0A0D0F443_9SPHI|nr:hypothetical protein [Pedobacter lusitanus]KIO76318.1 hypothetical protein TH53_15285 [Pedobacter lusitanus]